MKLFKIFLVSLLTINSPVLAEPLVYQLLDVEPTDWAYEALLYLVEKYGCIAGYPDQTFGGNRVLTRYEFAAGLNSCLNSLASIDSTDIETIKRLQTDFQPELQSVKSKVETLETRVSTLEDQNFSTTVKLFGLVTLNLMGATGSERADGSGSISTNPAFMYTGLLSFNASFTGTDQLTISLYSANQTPIDELVTGTDMTRIGIFDLGFNDQVVIGDLVYRFNVTKNLHITIDAVGGQFTDSVSQAYGGPLTPFIFAPYNSSISRFGVVDPAYYQILFRPGVVAVQSLGDRVFLGAGYFGNSSNSNDPNQGFFGTYAAAAQVTGVVTEKFIVTLLYINAYDEDTSVSLSGETSSAFANQPFGTTPTSSNHVSLGFGWTVTPKLVIHGDTSFGFATAKSDYTFDGNNNINGFAGVKGDNATIVQWNLGISLLDLFGEGNVGSIVLGNPYKVIDHSRRDGENSTAWHLEASYKYQLNDNIYFQSGYLIVLNPENNSDNSAVGTWIFKTVFSF
ncbi:iron uptake porin [Gloeocapsa sp. PCC 73106]|uniref:iron uptake porin n=1 Tax=Gloeocapsa sp. PCC 73106 TaxID=102232 RepID=UPI0002ABF36C|nr:iron uptake porin [Gloeocapsa sp. PCC 73106]ELS00210.1 putative S-layer protein [Gloeocapsa sp. PCC 73106]